MTPWTVPHQVPLSLGFFRREYWSGLPFPSPGALLNSGIKPGSPALQVGSLWFPLKHTNLHSQSVIEVSESLYPHFKKDFNFER